MTFVSNLRDRESLVGTWVALGDPAIAELSASLTFEEAEIERWVDHGFDFVLAGVDIDYLKAGGGP